MIGDLIIAAAIGISVGVLLGVPWGVAICHTTLEDIEKERESMGRTEEREFGEHLNIK